VFHALIGTANKVLTTLQQNGTLNFELPSAKIRTGSAKIRTGSAKIVPARQKV
jgi:hypothetical protein